MKPITKTIIWLSLFSIAMGYLETAVVVYLRKLYYPEGFSFPLAPITTDIATAEFWREAATIIMLAGIGILSGKNKLQRFSFFIYCFAVWDLFYYIFLKLLLNWPESIFTWDILFLIPVPWVGPVIAPCIVACTMIVMMLQVVYLQEKGKHVYFGMGDTTLLIGGSLIIIFSFVWDYFIYLSGHSDSGAALTIGRNTDLFSEIKNYIPVAFNWWLFAIGELLLVAEIVFIRKRAIH